MELWRVSRFSELSGLGGLRYPGRWHTAGRPVVYMAESLAAAILETLVHLQMQEDEIPRGLLGLQISVSPEVEVEDLSVPADDWKAQTNATQALGYAWLKSGATALARVPSALLPRGRNYLLNPLHPDAVLVRLVHADPFDLDVRLLRRTRSATG